MKDIQGKTPRLAAAFLAGALSSLIAGASAQSGGEANKPVDPVFQSAPPVASSQTVVEVDDGSGGQPEATISVPQAAEVQVQVQQAPVAAPAATSVEVAPVASNPGALQQLEQSINAQQPATAPASDSTLPIVRDNPNLMTPYTVPRSAEGIFEGSDLTLREISYLTAERDRLSAMTERENAFVSQINARRAVVDALQAPTAAQAKEEEEAKAERERAIELEQSRPQASSNAAAAAPQPFINSIYSYDNKAYAEIFIGPNKVVATEGTVLVTGDRVVSIKPEGVVVRGKRGTKTLRVIGTAGTSM